VYFFGKMANGKIYQFLSFSLKLMSNKLEIFETKNHDSLKVSRFFIILSDLNIYYKFIDVKRILLYNTSFSYRITQAGRIERILCILKTSFKPLDVVFLNKRLPTNKDHNARHVSYFSCML